MENVEPEIYIVTPTFPDQFVRYAFTVGRDMLSFYLPGNKTFSIAIQVDQIISTVMGG